MNATRTILVMNAVETKREDGAFLREAARLGRRVQQVDGDDLFIYMRHGRNARGAANVIRDPDVRDARARRRSC
jgi:hypothetical protein